MSRKVSLLHPIFSRRKRNNIPNPRTMKYFWLCTILFVLPLLSYTQVLQGSKVQMSFNTQPNTKSSYRNRKGKTIKTAEVYSRTMPDARLHETRSKDIPRYKTSPPKLMQKYWFQADGRLDSVANLHGHPDSVLGKFFFLYDASNVLTQILEVSKTSQILKRYQLFQSDSGRFHVWNWNKGRLTAKYDFSKDSLLQQMTYYRHYSKNVLPPDSLVYRRGPSDVRLVILTDNFSLLTLIN